MSDDSCSVIGADKMILGLICWLGVTTDRFRWYYIIDAIPSTVVIDEMS